MRWAQHARLHRVSGLYTFTQAETGRWRGGTRAAGADEGNGLARLHGEAEAGEHGDLGPGGVGKPNVLKLQAPHHLVGLQACANDEPL